MNNKFFQILGSVGFIWSLAPGDVKATDEIELIAECGNRSTSGDLIFKPYAGNEIVIQEMKHSSQRIKIEDLKRSTISAKIYKISNGGEVECSNPISWANLSQSLSNNKNPYVPQNGDTFKVTFTALGNWDSHKNVKPQCTWKITKGEKK
jgi:hypothetical protein